MWSLGWWGVNSETDFQRSASCLLEEIVVQLNQENQEPRREPENDSKKTKKGAHNPCRDLLCGSLQGTLYAQSGKKDCTPEINTEEGKHGTEGQNEHELLVGLVASHISGRRLGQLDHAYDSRFSGQG